MTETPVTSEPPTLADADELASLTGLSSSDPGLLVALRRASDRFRGAVGHPVTHVEGDMITLDGDGSRTLLLPATPVTAVRSVHHHDQLCEGYQWSADGMLRAAGLWPNELGALHVVYDHGYTTVPADIADAVLEQAQLMLQADPGVASMSTGGVSVTYSKVGVTEGWSETVQRYRIRRGDRA